MTAQEKTNRAAAAAPIGYMPMPAAFSHCALFLHGRPRHEKYSDFWRRHPPMDRVHRAKIFSPFDALAGFDEQLAAKDVLYTPRRVLSEGEKEKLDEALALLQALTHDTPTARKNRPQARITCFVPCSDRDSSWYGTGGQYKIVSGTVQRVDGISRTVTIDGQAIPFADIAGIEMQQLSFGTSAAF